MQLKIALLQIAPAGDLQSAVQKGEEYCKIAKAGGADIALFPELYSCGYNIACLPPEKWQPLAQGGIFENSFSQLAARLEMAIGITYLSAGKRGAENKFTLFDMRGARALDYVKAHTCDFASERPLARGDDFPVCTLKTAAGEVRVGAMICFDREFPESARILMLRGAELILVPNACPMDINRLAQLRARAFENMTAIATCNYPAGVQDCNGNSTVYDGMAFKDGDMCVLRAPEEEGVYFADIGLDALRAYRREETMGNAYRRPLLYRDLVSEDVDEPFIRKDARR